MGLPSDISTLTSGCSSAVVEDAQHASATGTESNTVVVAPRRRRRHSFFIPRRKSIVSHIMDTEEGLVLKVSRGVYTLPGDLTCRLANAGQRRCHCSSRISNAD
jgi:hypothetical protein